MFESKTKKYEEIENPRIRAFLLEGDALYPEDAENFTIFQQQAFYNRYCAHFRKERPKPIETEDAAFASLPCSQCWTSAQ